MRAFGGAATYWLTDNERTVTNDHVAGIAVRHPEIVAVGGHYGITVATCVPADPESKGGSEATVRIAKADLVPTDANLRGDYTSWAELVEACEAFTAEVNARVHRGDPAGAGRDAHRGTAVGCTRCPNAHTRRRSGRPVSGSSSPTAHRQAQSRLPATSVRRLGIR